MEYSNRSMLIKDANIPLLAITVTRGGRVMDIYNDIIMEGECHSLNRMNQAFAQGRGPLRIRLSHLKNEVVEEIEHILFSTERPVQKRFFEGRGIDFRKRDIELWPTECQLCGGHGLSGVRVNEKAETGVPGLFAAGDAACVPKQHLTGAFVFGEMAAESAVGFMRSRPSVKTDKDRIAAFEKEHDRRFTTAGRDLDVREIEYKVRRLIGDYVISPKNEYKLDRWFEWSVRFRQEIRRQAAVRNGHELSKLYEVEHIVRCADFSAAASKMRRESRWGDNHFRTDFPERDDQNWLKHIVLKKGGEENGIRLETRPVIGLDGLEVKS
jgi:succinate dehydrogenase/fumarate reductase flavoprotein subunit